MCAACVCSGGFSAVALVRSGISAWRGKRREDDGCGGDRSLGSASGNLHASGERQCATAGADPSRSVMFDDLASHAAPTTSQIELQSLSRRPCARVGDASVTLIETIPVGTFRAMRDRVLALAATGSTAGKHLIIATASPCHGATTLLGFAGARTED